MAVCTRILVGLCLTVLLNSCGSEALPDFTSPLLNDPIFMQVMERLNAQQQKIEKLEATNAFQQRVIESLEENVEKLKQEMDEMKAVTMTTGKESEEHINNSHISSANSSTIRNGDINEQEKGTANRIHRQLPQVANVAFTVVLTHKETALGVNQNIIFNFVETNIGNAYNTHHGVFIAPVSGTYVFHATIFALAGDEEWCKIVVNGANKVDIIAIGHPSHHNSGSQSLVVHLNQGDDVAVQNNKVGANVYGDPNTWTTFSGFLLHSDAEVTGSSIVG